MHTTRILAIALICMLASFGLVMRAHTQGSTEVAEDAAGADDPVLATVNGHPITRSDAQHLLDQVRESGAFQGPEPTEAQAVEELIRRESVRRYVLDKKIDVSPEAIDARWKEMEERIAAAGATLEAVLKAQHLTEDELREIVYIQLALSKIAESKLTDDELANLQEEVRASHILVAVPRANPTEEDFAKSKEKIVAIKAELDAGTKTFEEGAAEYSDCPSKAQGGDLGFFPRTGAMVEPFAAAAYALKVGEVSDPVRTQFGYHLIKVADRSTEPAKQKLIDTKIADVIEDVPNEVKVERFYEGAPKENEAPDDQTDTPEDTDSSTE